MAELQTTSFDLEDFLKDEEPAKKRPRISPKPSCVVDVSFNDSGFFSPTRDVIAHSDVTVHCDVTKSAPSAGNTSVLSKLSSQARFADLIPSLKEIEQHQPTSLISALRPEHQLADRLVALEMRFAAFDYPNAERKSKELLRFFRDQYAIIIDSCHRAGSEAPYTSSLHYLCDRVETSLQRLESFCDASQTKSRLQDRDDYPYFLKRRAAFSKSTMKVLENWYREHKNVPYVTNNDMTVLTLATGATCRQVRKWLANKRNRVNQTRKQTKQNDTN